MSKVIFLFVLVFSLSAWAISYDVSTIKEGSGEPVKSGQLIQVHFKGWLTDSTLIDDSYTREEPLEFVLGAGQVIAGWDRGIVGMKLGEIRRIALPYELAYGDRAIGPIPAKSDLFFEVELMHTERPLPPDEFPKKEIKWKELAPGLSYFDEVVGKGAISAAGKVLQLHYTGWLSKGFKFGSSKDLGKPFQVVLGSGKLIKGWERGLNQVPEGTVRWLKVAPSMGYGPTPLAKIPANSSLIFRVDLLSVETDDLIAETMDFFPDTSSLAFKDGVEGLRYVVLKEGEGEPAQAGETSRVHYTGWLMDGTKFDSSKDRSQIFEFPLGSGRVIRAWDLGVEGMLPGEKRILLVPPGLGYGSRGGGPIPPDATLLFMVEYLGT